MRSGAALAPPQQGAAEQAAKQDLRRVDGGQVVIHRPVGTICDADTVPPVAVLNTGPGTGTDDQDSVELRGRFIVGLAIGALYAPRHAATTMQGYFER